MSKINESKDDSKNDDKGCDINRIEKYAKTVALTLGIILLLNIILILLNLFFVAKCQTIVPKWASIIILLLVPFIFLLFAIFVRK